MKILNQIITYLAVAGMSMTTGSLLRTMKESSDALLILMHVQVIAIFMLMTFFFWDRTKITEIHNKTVGDLNDKN